MVLGELVVVEEVGDGGGGKEKIGEQARRKDGLVTSSKNLGLPA